MNITYPGQHFFTNKLTNRLFHSLAITYEHHICWPEHFFPYKFTNTLFHSLAIAYEHPFW